MIMVNKLIRSAKNDVVDGNEKQFDDIADTSHNGETNGAWCSYFFEFWIKNDLPVISGFSQTSRKRRLSP